MKYKKMRDLWILARYFYRVGEPILSDEKYEEYTSVLKEAGIPTLTEYFNRTYDEDPIPTELLKRLGIVPIEIETTQTDSKYFEVLDEDKSLGCKAVTTYGDAWEFFQHFRNLHKDLIVSLKLDGINTKNLYSEGELKLSLSRGRSSESFNFTKQTKLVLPKQIPLRNRDLKIVGESWVSFEGLTELRKIDSGKYKTCKSAAISMLRVRHPLELYKFLNTTIFFVDGIADTISESFEILEQSGFSVVPHILIRWEEIPETLSDFKEWSKSKIFDEMWCMGEGIPSDGIVVEVNDLTFNRTVENQYADTQLALKFEQWSFNVYAGIVKNVLWRQNRVHASLRVEIEPVETVDGCTAQFINVFNPAILINNEIKVGSIVYFERNSGAVNILVQKHRLREGEAV